MGTTILRVAKVKSIANVRQAGAHQYRHHAETPNADPGKKSRNVKLLGSENLAKDVQARLNDLTKPPRKNAVLAMDGLMSLSSEFFITKDGKPDNDNLARFVDTSEEWLRERFGDNLVNCVLHLDESTPHLHFTVVPLDEKPDGRKVLNARDMFDKWQLADMQKSYNEALRKHIPEVEPPKHGSKASHTTIKQFYSELESIKEGMREEAKQALDTLRENATATLMERLVPMLSRQLEGIEEKYGKQFEEEIKKKLVESYEEEMKNEVVDAFESTTTLIETEKRFNEKVEEFAKKKALAAEQQARADKDTELDSFKI